MKGCCKWCQRAWRAAGSEGQCSRCRRCLECCGHATVVGSCAQKDAAKTLGQRQRSEAAYNRYHDNPTVLAGYRGRFE